MTTILISGTGETATICSFLSKKNDGNCYCLLENGKTYDTENSAIRCARILLKRKRSKSKIKRRRGNAIKN